MSTTFSITLHDGHPVLQHEGLTCLVDTGSPYSCHEAAVIPFLGREYPRGAIQMLDIPQLRALTGIPEFTTLLGMDIIGRYFTVFDYRARTITFSEEPMVMTGQRLEMGQYMNVPIIQVQVEGTPRRMYLDSGARLGYLTQTATQGRHAEAVEQDFHPSIGRFETPVFRLPGTVEGMSFEARYGNLPAALEGLLSRTWTNGILGHDFFSRFKVGIDTNGRCVWIEDAMGKKPEKKPSGKTRVRPLKPFQPVKGPSPRPKTTILLLPKPN